MEHSTGFRLAAERMTATRKLAAILAADVAGYSRLVGVDEEGTIARLQAFRRELIDPTISDHRGRIVKTTGDGLLVEFASVVDAVRCAVEVQRAMAERNSDVPTDSRIEFRVGINVGDIVMDGSDILGDGVNIASRLESLAETGGICVSARVKEDIRGKLDIAFEDMGEQHLKNIVQPVRVCRVRVDSKAPLMPALPLPDKPSVAVLPFQNMSGDPEQEYFSDGIAEDIITALSRSRSLFVIARNSSFTYKGRAVDVKQVARELGVRYVLEGSVRRGGNRVRITAQLIDGQSSNHLWAERYDRDCADVFAVQDEVTEAVAIVIEPTVAEIERQRAAREPPENLGAWEAYQRGLWHSAGTGAPENEEAKRWFRRAIELDPKFAAGYSGLAGATIRDASLYQTRDFDEAMEETVALARKAISLDPMDAVGFCQLSNALTLLGDYEGGLAEARRALATSPNIAFGHAALGVALLYSGSPREGINAIREALRRDPYDPLRFIRLNQIAMAHYYLREYEVVVGVAKEVIRSHPDHPLVYRWLAAALGQLGRGEEAREALQKAVTIAPKSFDMYVRHRHRRYRPEDYEHMLEGLRKAGWEG
jgi:adenylate cyclase